MHAFGVFTDRRPDDQMTAFIAYPRRKVRIMKFLSGITTLGDMTHPAIEDISVMRPPDPENDHSGNRRRHRSGKHLRARRQYRRPGLSRRVAWIGAAPVRYPDCRWSNAANQSGDDVPDVTSDITTEVAMRAPRALEAAEVPVRHLHLHTIKPFSETALLDHNHSVKGGVITLENHVTEGGIGSLVAEVMADNGVDKKLRRLGLQDTYEF